MIVETICPLCENAFKYAGFVILGMLMFWFVANGIKSISVAFKNFREFKK